jgi:uncharacterized protein
MLWGIAACFALLYGAALHRDASLSEGPMAATLPATQALSAAATAVGAADALDRWAASRDALYDGAPTFGAIARPVPAARLAAAAPPLPEPVPWAEGFAEAPVVDPALDADAWTPERLAPRRILIVGASSIQFAFGTALEAQLSALPGIEVERWGRHSTGLSRLDYFDWFTRGAELADAFQPDLVLAQVGGNDCQVITDHDAGRVALFTDDEWETAYAQRLTEFVEVFRSRGARVVVLGMPVMRSPSFRRKMERLNRVVETATIEAGEYFVSTWTWTADDAGNYLAVRRVDGRDRVLRDDDGIHMSVDGADYVSTEVIAHLRTWFDLPDPAAEQTP